jgi:fatty acid amide hydrolase 2
MKNSVGLVCRKNIKADSDADVIKLMKNAGAILLCITNMSELGLWIETSNRVYGKTKNPYDIRRISGSVGGEASLISGCGSLIGLGTDFGGGIRLSASFNGIFAHKPTNGKYYLSVILLFYYAWYDNG